MSRHIRVTSYECDGLKDKSRQDHGEYHRYGDQQTANYILNHEPLLARNYDGWGITARFGDALLPGFDTSECIPSPSNVTVNLSKNDTVDPREIALRQAHDDYASAVK